MPEDVKPGESMHMHSMLLLDGDDINRIREQFDLADVDKSGALGEGELMQMWKGVWPQLPNKALRDMADNMFTDLDPNGDGVVSWTELQKFFSSLNDRSNWNEVDRMVNGTYVPRPPTARETAWHIMDLNNTTYKDIPWWVNKVRFVRFMFSTLMTVAAVAILVIESDSSPTSPLRDKIVPGEAFCMLIFTIELIVRTMFAPDRKKFITSAGSLLDFFVIMPFFVGSADPRGNKPTQPGEETETFVLVLRYIQLIRLVRLFRLWRVGRQFEVVKVLQISVSRVFFTLVIGLVGVNSVNIIWWSAIIVVAERDQADYDLETGLWIRSNLSIFPDAGQPIVFQSTSVSMWWMMVTLTTVGYGDMYPATGGGKAIASAAMIVSIVLMAFPLTLLADSFAKVCADLETKKDAKKRSAVFTNVILAGKGEQELDDSEGDWCQKKDEDGDVGQSQQNGDAKGSAAGSVPNPLLRSSSDHAAIPSPRKSRVPPRTLDGVWQGRHAQGDDWTATIFDDKVTWSGGQSATLSYTDCGVEMVFGGESITGSANVDGTLEWADGDVWTRDLKPRAKEGANDLEKDNAKSVSEVRETVGRQHKILKLQARRTVRLEILVEQHLLPAMQEIHAALQQIPGTASFSGVPAAEAPPPPPPPAVGGSSGQWDSAPPRRALSLPPASIPATRVTAAGRASSLRRTSSVTLQLQPEQQQGGQQPGQQEGLVVLLRSDPGGPITVYKTDGRTKLCEVPDGYQFLLVREDADWYCVELHGEEAFIQRRDVTKQEQYASVPQSYDQPQAFDEHGRPGWFNTYRGKEAPAPSRHISDPRGSTGGYFTGIA